MKVNLLREPCRPRIYLFGNLTNLRSHDDDRFSRGQYTITRRSVTGSCSVRRDATVLALLELHFDEKYFERIRSHATPNPR